MSVIFPHVISGTNEVALRAQARRLRQHVQSRHDQDLGQVAWSLATRRDRLASRAVVFAANRDQLDAGLGALADGIEAPDVLRDVNQSGGAVVFLMSGSGLDLVELAPELMREIPGFAAQVAECADAFPPHCDLVLVDALRDGADVAWLDRAGVLEAATFGLTVAFARLWTSCGVRPDFVIGVGQHRLAAAYLSGALSIEDAAMLAARSGGGESTGGSPGLTYCGAMTYERSGLPEQTADHWHDGDGGTTGFEDTVRALVTGGEPVTFIEIGSPTALLESVREIGRESKNPDVAVYTALRADTSARSLLVTVLAHAYLGVAEPRWEALFGEGHRRGVELPTYAFQRQRYWLDPGPVTRDAESFAPDLDAQPRSGAHDGSAGEPADERAALIELVRSLVAAVLGHRSTTAVPIHRPFKELGLDSLATQALSVRISEELHQTLATTSIYDYATVAKLADYLRLRSTPAAVVEVETMDERSLIKLVMGEDYR